ncbi:hypothetical protein HAX54_034918, partial [Datura stramonium]|nr:hypothetical protein [Datura stramonium]
ETGRNFALMGDHRQFTVYHKCTTSEYRNDRRGQMASQNSRALRLSTIEYRYECSNHSKTLLRDSRAPVDE